MTSNSTNDEQQGGQDDANSDGSGATCAIVALLPFTEKGTKPNAQFSIHLPVDHMAATLMAIDHFNSRDASVASALGSDEMSRCDLRIPATPGFTVMDDGDFVATSAAALRRADEEGDVCAVVGPYRNKAAVGSHRAKGAAHASGAMGVPMISYGAADAGELGRPHLQPLTIKNTADEYDRADAAMDHLKNYLGRDYVTLLHTADLSDLATKVLGKAAKTHGVTYNTVTITQPFTKTSGEFSLPNAMQRIKDSGFRTVIVALYTGSHWQYVEKAADEFGLTGPEAGYFWMAWDTADVSLLTAPTDSTHRRKMLNGMGAVRMLDQFAYKGDEDPFLMSWRSQNATFVKRLNELNPIQLTEEDAGSEGGVPGHYLIEDDYFAATRDTPSPYSTYIYDSVISIGMGACKARAKELERAKSSEEGRALEIVTWPNTGTDDALFNELVTVEFEGASGSVVLHDEVRYNRNARTIPFGMYNLRPKSDDDGFEAVLTSYKLPGSKTWSPARGGDGFVYADGTANQPILKTAEVEDPTDRTVAYVAIGFVCAGVVSAVLVYFYVRKKRMQSDSVWSVVPSELKFHQPPEVIGQGTFGLVVLAEYRGTQVAVKRVLPVAKGAKGGANASGAGGPLGSDNFFLSNILDRTETATTDGTGGNSGHGVDDVETGVKSGTLSGSHRTGQKNWLPLENSEGKLQQKLRKEFVAEMRYLSKLRHPCVTTVMGAVIAKKYDPMLVMEYMDHGSLHDLLHNKTIVPDGDLILPILRDIAQGLRFLHAANPRVIHGDLKAANVLVDSKFRAKVADFGLSQKKTLGATGTPYWMAPELLRRESIATAASDIYSFGIILYEVYSRKDPYEGENYHDVIGMIADPLVNKRPPVPPSCPEPVASIMKSCLKGAGDFRPTAEEIDKELKRLDVASAGPRTIKGERKDEENEHALLYELLPKHVADVLRGGGKVQPESRDLVTIFFSDIVGFTDISSSLTPIKISDMLDRLYGAFDEISQKHDVFKVETIGDAYMAVTNLIKDQPEDHAKRIAEFSIDAIDAANGILIDVDEPEKGYINIRVGFHSGPVVANVVGTRNPRYCLFGDTVNTASRMESNSKENRIHCSSRAAGLLIIQWPELNLEPRGRIKVKGKGEMNTFWVNKPRGSAGVKVLSKRVSLVATAQPVVEGPKRKLSE